MHSKTISRVLTVFALGYLAFLYIPLLIVVIYSFNNSVSQTWPISSSLLLPVLTQRGGRFGLRPFEAELS